MMSTRLARARVGCMRQIFVPIRDRVIAKTPIEVSTHSRPRGRGRIRRMRAWPTAVLLKRRAAEPRASPAAAFVAVGGNDGRMARSTQQMYCKHVLKQPHTALVTTTAAEHQSWRSQWLPSTASTPTHTPAKAKPTCSTPRPSASCSSSGAVLRMVPISTA